MRRLLGGQFPQWAGLPLEPVPSAGTDNALYRLGPDMVVRLPRGARAAGHVGTEHEWLPRLAPELPLAVPVPVAMGHPAEGHPWPWSVCRWLDGQDAVTAPIADLRQAASALARFVVALRGADCRGGPPAGEHNFFRGVALGLRDGPTRAGIDALEGVVDTGAATEAWDAALGAPAWAGAPVWVHGDLHGGNLLVKDGVLRAVLDFGGLGVGDPACDVMVAWTFLAGEAREHFRTEVKVDVDTWARGRGWALSVSLVALAYYRDRNPVLAGISERAIQEVLADR